MQFIAIGDCGARKYLYDAHHTFGEMAMSLPDYAAPMIQQALGEVLAKELGVTTAAVVQTTVGAMLQRTLMRGVATGMSISATASGETLSALRNALTEQFHIDMGLLITEPALTGRSSRSGRRRAVRGSVGQAIDHVLADQPGSRIIEIQDLAVQFDPTIKRSSVTNELRRYRETRYRQEGKRWFRISDEEQGVGLEPGMVPVPSVGESEAGAPASDPPAIRAA